MSNLRENRQNERSVKRLTLCGLMLMLGIVLYPNPCSAETNDAPYVKEAKLISNQDIELYWSEAVTGAGDNSTVDVKNFFVTVDGEENPIWSYTWEEYNYSETDIVYYSPKSSEYPNNPDTPKTSFRLTYPITDTENLPDIKVSIAGNKIKNASGTYAAAQTVSVTEYDAFYQQEITMDSGVKILGTKNVRPEAMTKAEEMLKVILANPTIAKRMGDAGCMLGIFGEGEIAYDILEHRYTYDENYLYVEGFGGTQLASIKDANVLRLKAASSDYYTNYPDESILTHEFGHTVQNFGLSEEQQSEWEEIYRTSVTEGGKWSNSYAGSNSSEYFATLSAIWFNAMDDTWDGNWDGVRGPINTRRELKAYDRAAYDFLSEIYVSDAYLPSPWENGTVPDNHTWEGVGDDDDNDGGNGGNTTDPGDGGNGGSITDPGQGGNGGGAAEQPISAEEKRYTVTWQYNNGSAAVIQTAAGGSVLAAPETPVRKGYLWLGWYAGGSKYTFTEQVTQDIVLEAMWQKVTVKKASISSLKAKKGRKIALTVKKVSGADGYKITFSTNSKFKKSVKTKYITSNKLTLKKLKKGTWYVKVQAYQLDSAGNKVFGKASKVNKVMVKK